MASRRRLPKTRPKYKTLEQFFKEEALKMNPLFNEQLVPPPFRSPEYFEAEKEEDAQAMAPARRLAKRRMPKT